MKDADNPVLADNPNPRTNVFLMMRFRNTAKQRKILQALKEALKHYGLHGLRADDQSYSTSLWSNVKTYMDACDLGVAVFEQIEDKQFNPNVSLELGYMMGAGKRVLLLKEKHLEKLQSDIVGQYYQPFDSDDIQPTIRTSVRKWLRDIGIAKSSTERVVLLVSEGGTCRCAMAKVALDHARSGRRLPYKLRVVSVAYKYAGTNRASRGARGAVTEAYGHDYLRDHWVTRRSPGLLADADLILTMEEKLRRGFPSEKTFLFKPFFGSTGEVRNPWPDNKGNWKARYRRCMQQIRRVVEEGFDSLLSHFDAHP